MNELECRALKFAIDVRLFVKSLPRNTASFEDGKQVIKSSGSIGANYIEANEKLGEKDLVFRMKIARKEAKETVYWLTIIRGSNESGEINIETIDSLIDEANQLRKILSAIINKLSS